MNKPVRSLEHPSVIAAICLVGAIGALIFNLLPVLVGSAADSRQLNSQQIGFMGTSYFLGYTLASVGSVFWVKRFSWPMQAVLSIAIALCGLAYTAYTESYSALLTGFFILGCGAGGVYALTFYIVGCSKDPDRIFGFKVFVEIATPALAVWILSNYVLGAWGFNGALVSIMLLFLMLSLGVLALPKNAAPDTTTVTDLGKQPAAHPAGPGWLVWLGLFGLLLWMCGTTGTWVFLERMGSDLGFATGKIGTVLSVALLISAMGALGAGFIGDLLGRKLPLCTANLVALVALGLLWSSDGFAGYALALCLFSFGWVTAFPYLLGIIASADFKGNLVVLASAALSLGGAIGPGIAGLIKSGASYMPILVYGGISILAGLLVFLYLDTQLDRLGDQAGSEIKG